MIEVNFKKKNSYLGDQPRWRNPTFEQEAHKSLEVRLIIQLALVSRRDKAALISTDLLDLKYTTGLDLKFWCDWHHNCCLTMRELRLETNFNVSLSQWNVFAA